MEIAELVSFFKAQPRSYFRGPDESCMSFTYGEVTVEGLVELIEDAKCRCGKHLRCFLDLGSGSGLAVLCAAAFLPALCYSVGVELSQRRHALAVQACRQLHEIRPDLHLIDRVLFLHGDATAAVSPVAAADVIWISNTCFPDHLNRELGRLVQAHAAKGTLVYSTCRITIPTPLGEQQVRSAEVRDFVDVNVSWAMQHSAEVIQLIGDPDRHLVYDLGHPVVDSGDSDAESGCGAVRIGNTRFKADESVRSGAAARAFAEWATEVVQTCDADALYLLKGDSLYAAVSTVLLAHVPPEELLVELCIEKKPLHEVCSELSDDCPDGVDLEAFVELCRQCLVVLRPPRCAPTVEGFSSIFPFCGR